MESAAPRRHSLQAAERSLPALLLACCQSASNIDPGLAFNIDPPRACLGVHWQCLKRQLSRLGGQSSTPIIPRKGSTLHADSQRRNRLQQRRGLKKIGEVLLITGYGEHTLFRAVSVDRKLGGDEGHAPDLVNAQRVDVNTQDRFPQIFFHRPK